MHIWQCCSCFSPELCSNWFSTADSEILCGETKSRDVVQKICTKGSEPINVMEKIPYCIKEVKYLLQNTYFAKTRMPSGCWINVENPYLRKFIKLNYEHTAI